MKAAVLALALVAPLAGYDVSSGFGYRDSLGGLTPYRLHDGIDYAAPLGTPVHAAGDGWVREFWPYKRSHPVYGNMVIIEHAPGIYTLYGHLSKVYVTTRNEFVRSGDVIGLVGSTGMSTGPHLHFQLLINPELVIVQPEVRDVDYWSAWWGDYARRTQRNVTR